jgi:hypothetical protein
VGDQRDAPLGIVDLPHGQIGLDAAHATFGQEQRAAEVDAIDEVAHRLAAVEAGPALV